MQLKTSLITIFALLLTIGIANAQTYENGYSYRQQINVTNNNNSISMPANFSFTATIDTQTLVGSSKLQSDCDDLKVYFGTSELERYIDSCNDAQTNLTFLIQESIPPGATNSNHYLYYGNPSDSGTANDWNAPHLFAEDWENCAVSWTTPENGAFGYRDWFIDLQSSGSDTVTCNNGFLQRSWQSSPAGSASVMIHNLSSPITSNNLRLKYDLRINGSNTGNGAVGITNASYWHYDVLGSSSDGKAIRSVINGQYTGNYAAQSRYQKTNDNVIVATAFYNSSQYGTWLEYDLRTFNGIWTIYFEGEAQATGINNTQTYPGMHALQIYQERGHFWWDNLEFDYYVEPKPTAVLSQEQTPPVLIAEWDLLSPPTNTFHNSAVEFNYSTTDTTGTANCTLIVSGQTNTTATSLTDGYHTLTYLPSDTDSFTGQFYIHCIDDLYSSNTTTKTLRIDVVEPAIMSYTPLIDNTTTVDKQIQLNISIYNDYMNNSNVNITGGGDTAYYSSTAGTPTHAYTDTVNTTGWTEGTKTVRIFGDDQLNQNTMFVSFDVCHAVWTCSGYDTCTINDTAACNAVTDTNCGYNTTAYTGDYSEFTPNSCNYCTSTYEESATVCFAQTQDISYTYTNTCCEDTGLPSDCNIPANQTGVSCSLFTYNEQDVAPAAIDVLGSILVALVAFAPLVGLVYLGTYLRRRLKR